MTTLQFDFVSILQSDFFVLNKDTDECHIGEKMGATSTLSDETDNTLLVEDFRQQKN